MNYLDSRFLPKTTQKNQVPKQPPGYLETQDDVSGDQSDLIQNRILGDYD